MIDAAGCGFLQREIEIDDGIVTHVWDGHAIRYEDFCLDGGTTENSKLQRQVRACSGSLESSHRAWLRIFFIPMLLVVRDESSCGTGRAINGRGCTLEALEDIFIDNFDDGLVRERFVRGCTRFFDDSTVDWGCTRTSGATNLLGHVFTMWFSENSMRGRIDLVCSGSLNPRGRDSSCNLRLRGPSWQFALGNDHARMVRGCTRTEVIHRTERDNYTCSLGRNHFNTVDNIWIAPWILRLMMGIQYIGHSYVIFLQFFLLVASRLLFLKFDSSNSAGASEAGWQILRGVFWACATIWLIWRSRKPPAKRLVVVSGSRHCVCLRRRHSPNIKYMLWACMVLNTHAIHVVQAADTWPYPPVETEPASGLSSFGGFSSGQWTLSGDSISQDDFESTGTNPNGHSLKVASDGWQSHVSDLWCIAGLSFADLYQRIDTCADMFLASDATLSGEGISLLQVTSSVLLAKTAFSSFTDDFMDLSWPLTTRGDRDLAAAADTDPESLRLRWQVINTRNGIPRPINVASYMLHRPPFTRILADIYLVHVKI